MRTRKMNVRITFFKKVGEQNEDGEVLTFKKKCLYKCWAEVSKTSIKDFRENATVTKASGLLEHKDTKTFLIRHLPKLILMGVSIRSLQSNEIMRIKSLI